jgi:glycosyltransferase involved in cell wall biosynthesis
VKILLVNKFLYPKGGDAISTLNTGRLLEHKRHQVVFWGMNHSSNPSYAYEDYFVNYADFDKPNGVRDKTRLALNLLYSLEAKRKIDFIIKIEKPDIVHLHNFAHQISPSILDTVKKYKLPIVMTLHDYKMVCPSYSMLSNGKVCDVCREGKYYNCFLRRCVKKSRIKSLLNTLEMYLHHNILHIYDAVDIFISPSVFLRDRLKSMGFKGRVVYLPNFIYLDKLAPQYNCSEPSVVYFGRLSREKGLVTLINAIKHTSGITLNIIGDGPIKDELVRKANGEGIRNIKFMGYRTGNQLTSEIRKSMAIVLPSECYENNPLSVIEGFALGKAAVAACIGGIPELVKNGVTGLTFEAGNADELKSKLNYVRINPDKMAEMGKNARRLVESELSAEIHYGRLMDIYEMAKNNRG